MDWANGVAAELAAMEDVRLLTRTTAFGYYGENLVGLIERVADHLPAGLREPDRPRQRVWRVRARQVVLATGAIERLLVFNGNDRPGVMLAGAVSGYLHRYGVIAGRNAVVFTNNDSAWQTAFDLKAAGGHVAAIVDTRRSVAPGLLAAAAELRERPFTSSVPVLGPLLARLRDAWNNVASRWYLNHLMIQQSEFNRLAAREIERYEIELHEQMVLLEEQIVQTTELQRQIESLEAGLAQLQHDAAGSSIAHEHNPTAQ